MAASLAVRAGLHVLVAERRRIEVTGEAASFAEAADLVRRCDVLLAADPGAPVPADALAGLEPPPALLVLARGPADVAPLLELPPRALRAWGAVGLDAPAAELRAAVAALAEGLNVAPRPLLQGLLRRPRAADGPAARLTPREVEVLGLLAEGLANKQIGAELGISDHTVKFHVASIYAKLEAANRIEAVQAGLRQGLLSV